MQFEMAVVSDELPDEIVARRKDSPLVLGSGGGEKLLASDIPARMDYIKNVCLVEDGEIAVLWAESVHICDKYMQRVETEVFDVTWDLSQA